MKLRHDQPCEQRVDHKSRTRDCCHDHDLALRLQKLCAREIYGVGKDLWDHVDGEYSGHGRDPRGLAYECQDWSGEDVEKRKDESGYGQNHP